MLKTGSEFYWKHGNEPGSEFYWKHGNGPGSEFYWKHGNGPGNIILAFVLKYAWVL